MLYAHIPHPGFSASTPTSHAPRTGRTGGRWDGEYGEYGEDGDETETGTERAHGEAASS